jgi:uncharacterized protein
MRLLIDIGHPAHVHLFRNLFFVLKDRGHEVFITARNKEMTYELLDKFGMPYYPLGSHQKSLVNKIIGWFGNVKKIIAIIRSVKPDILLSHGSFYCAQSAFLTGKEHISLEDTGNMEQVWLYLPFTKAVLTPDCFTKKLGKKQFSYPGYHELAYLHPNYFHPDEKVKESLGIAGNDKFVLIRLVSRTATHEFSQKGLEEDQLDQVLNAIKPYARVFISSEVVLASKYDDLMIHISPDLFHSAIYFAAIVIGNSPTVSSEAAVLGTPALYFDNRGRCYTNEEEKKYRLVNNYTETTEQLSILTEKAIEILNSPNSITDFKHRSKLLLRDKIDFTSFLSWFLEEYPGSLVKLRANTVDYQNFR